ncbi:MAG TPA: histidine--tRNA ligase [Candidatus Limousia pullorum]|uniref:Histidine--tRNA ligase n=1 Tax=Candidatus Limousia pullorum TaxID=2840860 RepID=A0A9D1S7S2_9FIRM|nr:histidine--tRNA ligase [Anaeromassilibacillus sp. An172]OUP77884.1 histidine--tRNA ligase [Anaeromassilibacillus sp. An172]HIU50030.1 histidine--tRNA ligase [Candidatus Limousia pullorum]
MALITKKVKGTEDVLPKDSYKWQFVEEIMRKEAQAFGFKEIRTPVFEHTELFSRGVGETTDVVQKEMYTFSTKGDASITLRPEGTAGAARALLEHAIYNDGLPVKASYFVSCYRYEKPQAGRLREFHQFGLECYGTSSPAADAEMISAAASVFKRLNIENLRLEINSIGCPECRKNYHKALKEYFEQYKDQLCETCLSRLERNPMRILDCKSPVCSEIAKDAPKVLDYICDECREHFEGVKKYLDAANIEYTVNPTIVRGLDYYTKTVFEFVTDCIGAQGTVCGGGRYDGLVEELGGQHLPSLGFAMGIERLLILMDKLGIEIPKPETCDIYIAGLGEKGSFKAFELASKVRTSGLIAETDVVGRGLRAQMKYADKIGAKFSMVLGDDEIENNVGKLKNMKTGEITEVSLDDNFLIQFQKAHVDYAFTINN